MPLTGKALLDMSQDQLDELFRTSPPGPIPSGEAFGQAIILPGSAIAELAASVVEGVAWQGKVFDPATSTLRNKVTAAGLHEIVAQVYLGTSWFDERECIVLDYSKTSTVAKPVRDEIREVAPQLYLGIVFIGDHHKTINFSLDFGAAASRQSPLKRLSSWARRLVGRKDE
jgi:hypothetical protein